MSNYFDFLPETFTEDELWEAIAESMGLEYADIADGDLAEYL